MTMMKMNQKKKEEKEESNKSESGSKKKQNKTVIKNPKTSELMEKQEVNEERSNKLDDWVSRAYFPATKVQKVHLVTMKTPAVIVLSTDVMPPNKLPPKWIKNSIFVYITWDIKQLADVVAWSKRFQLVCHTTIYVHLSSPAQVPSAGPLQHVVPVCIFAPKEVQIFSDASSQSPDLITSPKPTKNEKPPCIQTHLDPRHVFSVQVWQVLLEKFHCLSNNDEFILDFTPAYGHLMVAAIIGRHRYLAFETSSETFRTITNKKIQQTLILSNIKQELYDNLPLIVKWKLDTSLQSKMRVDVDMEDE